MHVGLTTYIHAYLSNSGYASTGSKMSLHPRDLHTMPNKQDSNKHETECIMCPMLLILDSSVLRMLCWAEGAEISNIPALKASEWT